MTQFRDFGRLLPHSSWSHPPRRELLRLNEHLHRLVGDAHRLLDEANNTAKVLRQQAAQMRDREQARARDEAREDSAAVNLAVAKASVIAQREENQKRFDLSLIHI